MDICDLDTRIGEAIVKIVIVNCLEGLDSIDIGEDRLMKYKKKVIAIIGSRKYKNKAKMFEILDRIHWAFPKSTWGISVETGPYRFISGGADGPDTWADEWCELHHLEFKEYPILKDEHPFDRNFRVAQDADYIIAFVNRNQFRSGTWNTIRHFRERDGGQYIVYDQDGKVWDRKWKE